MRQATPADESSVIEMIGQLQEAQPAAARHRWLYQDNPAGPALTWLAVEPGNARVVGITSYFPWRLQVGGEAITGALGGDGFVREEYRRRGIGAALHAASRKALGEHHLCCMYGAPGEQNVTPLQLGGSRPVGAVVRYLRPVRAAALGIRNRAVGRAIEPLLAPRRCRARLDPVVADDPRVDEVWAATAPELPLAAVRDACFYTWRFVRAPSQRQHPFVIVDDAAPIGVCALERVGARLRIIDLVASARQWARCVRAIAASAGDCDAIELRLTERDRHRRALRTLGFLKRPGKPFLVMVPEASTLAPQLLDPARWYYTLADSDVDAND